MTHSDFRTSVSCARIGTFALLTGLLSVCALARANEKLAYVHASSQAGRFQSPLVHHPMNLLDDNRETIWCEGARGIGKKEEARFIFKKPQRIDRIVIAPAPSSGREVKVVRVSDGTKMIEIEIDDLVVEQPLSQPMRGNTFTVSIEEVGAAVKSSPLTDDVACLGDVMLYQGKRPFGEKLGSQTPPRDALLGHILGEWRGGPFGAPEKFLTFTIDGSWQWRHVPLLEAEKARASGKYRIQDGRFLMRLGRRGRWVEANLQLRKTPIDPDDIGAPIRAYQTLSVNGDFPVELSDEYNNAEF